MRNWRWILLALVAVLVVVFALSNPYEVPINFAGVVFYVNLLLLLLVPLALGWLAGFIMGSRRGRPAQPGATAGAASSPPKP
jgi:uncharacterized integral membrane protein